VSCSSGVSLVPRVGVCRLRIASFRILSDTGLGSAEFWSTFEPMGSRVHDTCEWLLVRSILSSSLVRVRCSFVILASSLSCRIQLLCELTRCHRMEWFPSSVQRKTIKILHKWSESFLRKEDPNIYKWPA
jgi:hypothetical protein